VVPGWAAPDLPVVERLGERALKLRWRPAPKADGYRVYRWSPGRARHTVLATLDGPKARSLVDRKVPAGAVRSYAVRAFRVVKGVRLYSELSYKVRAKAFKDGSTIRNAARFDCVQADGTMAMGGRSDLCTLGNMEVAVLSDRAKAKPLSPKVRYKVASGLGIVSVDAKGRVTARRAGQAKVRVIAHNGAWTTAAIKVADYSHPGWFDTAGWGEEMKYAYTLLREPWASKVKDLARRLSAWTGENITAWTLNPKGDVFMRTYRNDGHWRENRVPNPDVDAPTRALVEEILLEYPYPIHFRVVPGGGVSFTVDNGEDAKVGRWAVIYYVFGLVEEPQREPNNGFARLAPHWSFDPHEDLY
jgi:hypothetical protein